MKEISRVSKQTLLKRLVENAVMESVILPHRKQKPGERILNLSEKERDVLKTLTSNDVRHWLPKFAPFYEESYYKSVDKKKR
jgi:hypothetical protein